MSANQKQKTGLVPKLRFPEFWEAGEWERSQLVDVCTKIANGGTPDTSKPEFWGGTINWMTPAEMGKTENPFIGTTNRTITELGLSNCTSDLLPLNTVILSVRAPIGHLAINTVPIAINQGCKGLIAGNYLNFYFLYYSLLNTKLQLINLGAGNTFKELSGSALKSFEIPIPHKAEQQKIADCLTSLDDLIRLEAEKLNAIKAHKKGLMQQLFPAEGETLPKLRFPEFREAGESRVNALVELVKFFSGGTPSKAEPTYWDGNIPWISASSMHEVIIEDADLRVTNEAIGNGTRLAKKGCILILVRGSMLFKRVPICITIRDVAFNQDVKALTVAPDVVSMFLLYQLIALSPRIPINETGIGAGKIETEVLESLEIWVPEISEQQKIADCLSALDTQITTQAEKIEALKAHKKGLMQQLFPVLDEAGA